MLPLSVLLIRLWVLLLFLMLLLGLPAPGRGFHISDRRFVPVPTWLHGPLVEPLQEANQEVRGQLLHRLGLDQGMTLWAVERNLGPGPGVLLLMQAGLPGGILARQDLG